MKLVEKRYLGTAMTFFDLPATVPGYTIAQGYLRDGDKENLASSHRLWLVQSFILLAAHLGEPVECSLGTFTSQDCFDPEGPVERLTQCNRGLLSWSERRLSRNGLWIWKRSRPGEAGCTWGVWAIEPSVQP